MAVFSSDVTPILAYESEYIIPGYVNMVKNIAIKMDINSIPLFSKIQRLYFDSFISCLNLSEIL